MASDKFFLCSHTHWDREWYGSFQQFRMRLVNLVDDLLEILDNDPGYRCFNFDGQTIVLEDYLEIRPEMEASIRKHIDSGRLVIGPWYILPDEFLVTGESTVRNLMRGASIGKRFGRISSVGYIPDTFGHFGQMPQILKQWGLPVAILWRGISGGQYKNELLWEAPDGSRVVLSKIAEAFGYITAALFVGSLPFKKRQELLDRGIKHHEMATGEDAVEGLVEACKYIKETSATNCHLLLNGVDHMPANPEIPALIEKVNERLAGGELKQVSFDEYAGELLNAVNGKDLQVLHGELRDTVQTADGGGIILNGVLSSRIYLKQQNQECCTLLENWAEPFSAFSAMLGGRYEKGFIDKAWQWTLRNHPHDSIGGCSVDAVHRQMETRFEWAREICDNLLEFTFTRILEKAKVEGLEGGEYAFAVFNPGQNAVSGWMKVEMEAPESLGPNGEGLDWRGVMVKDMDGKVLKSWLMDYRRDTVNRPALKRFTTAMDKCPKFTFSFWAEDIPACGYKLFKFRPLDKPNCIFGRLSPETNVLENEFLKARINSNGTICLEDKKTGHTYENLHFFEDGGDNGGGYAYSFPKRDEVFTNLSSNANISLIENSEARAAYKVLVTMELPEALDASQQGRSDRKSPLTLESTISLGYGAKRLDIETRVINTVKDHRLRVGFPTYLKTEISSAEGHFDVVDHPIEITQPSLDIWKEDQPKQFMQKSFVSVSDGDKGLAIANIGLPEYEVGTNNETSIFITLMRSVAYLSTQWKNTRLMGAGPVIETPEAQMVGRELIYRYSIIPHTGKWDQGEVQAEAHNFNQGLKAYPVIYSGGETGTVSNELSFLSVDGKNIVLSSVKGCEDGNGFAVRIWNGSADASTATIRLIRKPSKVYESNIKEELVREIDVSQTLSIPLGAKSIVTLRVEF